MTWSVRGIDDEARERVLDEARRAGLSVGEYLNTLILRGDGPSRGRSAGDASRGPEPEPAGRDIDRRLEEIGERLRAMSATAKSGARATPPGPGRPDADLAAGTAEKLERAAARPPAAQVARVAEILDTLEGLDRQLKSMPRRGEAGRPVVPQQPGGRSPAVTDTVGRAVAEIAARQRALSAASPEAERSGRGRGADTQDFSRSDGRGRDRRPDDHAAPAREPEARPATAGMSAAEIERHFRALTERIDALGARRDGEAAVADMAGELRRLRGSVESRLSEIPTVADLETLKSITAGRGEDAVAEIAAEIRRLRNSVEINLASGPSGADIADLKALGARIEKLAAQRPDAGLVDPLVEEIARLRETIVASSPERALRGLEVGYGKVADRLDDLRRRMNVEGLADRLGEEMRAIRDQIGALPPPARLEAIEDGIEAISGRLDELAARPAPRLGDKVEREIADLRAGLAAYDPNQLVAVLDQRLRALTDRLEGIERLSRGPVAPDRLVGLVDELRSIAAPDRTIAELRAVEARVEEVVERLADLSDRRRETELVEVLGDRIAAIAERVEDLHARGRQDASAEDLAQRIADLGRRLESAPRGATDPKRLDEIEAVLKRVEAQLAGARSGQVDLIEAFESRLTRLVERMERFEPRAGASADVSGVGREIAALRSELARSLAHRPEVAIEARLERLADTIERGVPAPAADGKAFAEIERRLADITAQLAEVDRSADFGAVEDAIAQIHRALAERQDGTLEAVRSAAREAIHEFVARAEGQGSTAAIEALRDEIRALQDETRRPDPAADQTLRSVQDALASVVDRLKTIETRQALREEEESDAAIAAVAARFVPEHRRAETGPEDNRPLDIGSGKPTFGAAARLLSGLEPPAQPAQTARSAAEPAAAPATAAAPAAASSRKADFIAAARRAAQAAHAARETLPVDSLVKPAATVKPVPAAAASLAAGDAEAEAPLEAAGGRVGPLARIGRVLRGGRRPLMLAAAAVLLAVVALRFVPGQSEAPPVASLDKAQSRLAALTAGAAKAPAKDASLVTGSISTSSAEPAAPAPVRSVPPRPEAAADAASPVTAPPETRSATTFGAAPVGPAPSGFGPAPSGFGAGPSAPGLPATGPAAASLVTETADPIITGGLAPAKAGVAERSIPASAALPEAIGPAALRKAAAEGDPKAQFEIGLRFAEGRAVAADPKAASDWYAKAAAQGYAPAQYRLGSAWEKGHAGRRDAQEAKRWYQAAAEQGNLRAMHNLGVLYSNDRDMTNAVAWFQKAADHGVRDSQFNLGIIHALGSGVKQDLAVSYKWFALAAMQGDKDAEKKRDDVAAHLDRNALAAARTAVQTYRPAAVDRLANEEVTTWAEPAAAAAATPVVGPGARPAAPSPAAALAGPAASATAVAATPADGIGRLQTLLREKGAYAGPIDGELNVKTRQALRAWQRKMGLKVTGEPDAASIAALEGKAG